MNPLRGPIIVGNWKTFHGGRSGALLAADCVKVERCEPSTRVQVGHRGSGPSLPPF